MFDKDNIRTIIESTEIGRDFAGRDIIHNHISEDKASDYINILYDDYEKERINDDTKKIIEELEHYKSKLEGDVLGLKAKLEKANIARLYSYAERVKENFAKKLVQFENSQSAQNIFLHLLAKIDSNFHRNILIRLDDDMDKEKVIDLVNKYIHKEITVILKENILGINDTDIDGMLFYLTGNCHINWT